MKQYRLQSCPDSLFNIIESLAYPRIGRIHKPRSQMQCGGWLVPHMIRVALYTYYSIYVHVFLTLGCTVTCVDYPSHRTFVKLCDGGKLNTLIQSISNPKKTQAGDQQDLWKGWTTWRRTQPWAKKKPPSGSSRSYKKTKHSLSRRKEIRNLSVM